MGTVTTTVNESNGLIVNATFIDINGNPYIPQAVAWRLWDDSNKFMLQDWTALSEYGTTASFEIPGALNQIENSNNLTERHMVLLQTTIPGGENRFDTAYYNVISIPDET